MPISLFNPNILKFPFDQIEFFLKKVFFLSLQSVHIIIGGKHSVKCEFD